MMTRWPFQDMNCRTYGIWEIVGFKKSTFFFSFILLDLKICLSILVYIVKNCAYFKKKINLNYIFKEVFITKRYWTRTTVVEFILRKEEKSRQSSFWKSQFLITVFEYLFKVLWTWKFLNKCNCLDVIFFPWNLCIFTLWKKFIQSYIQIRKLWKFFFFNYHTTYPKRKTCLNV